MTYEVRELESTQEYRSDVLADDPKPYHERSEIHRTSAGLRCALIPVRARAFLYRALPSWMGATKPCARFSRLKGDFN